MNKASDAVVSGGETDGELGDVAVQEYLQLCRKYRVEMDPALVIVLKTRVPIFKPSRKYEEKDLLPFGDLLLSSNEEVQSGVKSITSVDFTHAAIGSNGAIWLYKVFRNNKTVTSLNLTSTGIGPRGAQHLAYMIKENETIQKLILHGNKLYLKGGLRIADGLKCNTSLTELDLSNNHIGFAAHTELEQILLKHKEMKSFNLDDNFVLEEVMNSVTHGVGDLLALIGTMVLMSVVWDKSIYHRISCAIFSLSLLILYTSSTLYHGFFKLRRTKAILKIMDHGSIYLLIAGTYTPFLMVSLHNDYGFPFLGLIWVLAISGIIAEASILTKDKVPSKLSTVLYVFMGWVIIFAIKPTIRNIPINGLYLLVVGGLFYTGGVYFFITGFKKPMNHAIWHVFVFLGSLCHYFSILLYVVPAELS